MKKKWLGCTIVVILLVIAIISIAFSDTSFKKNVGGIEFMPDVALLQDTDPVPEKAQNS